MLKKSVLFVVFVLSFSVASFAQNKVDVKLKKCLNERIHDVHNNEVNGLDVYKRFENKLILSGKLLDDSQESYAMLMANLLNDDDRIPVSNWAHESNFSLLSMPSNLASSMNCFTDISATTQMSYATSVSNMMPFLIEITADYNIGDKRTNIQLVRAVTSEDFDKMIYKVPLLALMHSIAAYKEEVVAIAGNY